MVPENSGSSAQSISLHTGRARDEEKPCQPGAHRANWIKREKMRGTIISGSCQSPFTIMNCKLVGWCAPIHRTRVTDISLPALTKTSPTECLGSRSWNRLVGA